MVYERELFIFVVASGREKWKKDFQVFCLYQSEI